MTMLRNFMTFLMLASFSTAYAGSGHTVNINAADAKTIAKVLKGVGSKKAKAIVEYRTNHGHFKSDKDLLKVKGIGKKTLAKNQGKIVYAMNPCSMKHNPCSMKMNPCSMKHNPCSMKHNPCAMKMNPCSMKHNPCAM